MCGGNMYVCMCVCVYVCRWGGDGGRIHVQGSTSSTPTQNPSANLVLPRYLIRPTRWSTRTNVPSASSGRGATAYSVWNPPPIEDDGTNNDIPSHRRETGVIANSQQLHNKQNQQQQSTSSEIPHQTSSKLITLLSSLTLTPTPTPTPTLPLSLSFTTDG